MTHLARAKSFNRNWNVTVFWKR